jgi:hypothetical protein
MRILSIDPATKSLAVSLLDFNENWLSEIADVSGVNRTRFHAERDLMARINILNEWIMEIKRIIDSITQLKYVNVFDLVPGKKLADCPAIVRAQRLKGVVEYIKHVNAKIGGPLDTVLIEYQMSLNDKSRGVSAGLVYAFSSADADFLSASTYMNSKDEFAEALSREKCRVEIVGAALKGKVYFGSGNIQNFRKKYMSNYDCNKAHSKHNFLTWIADHDQQHLIEGIPKGNLDDVADSFLMAYAWAIKESFAQKMNAPK